MFKHFPKQIQLLKQLTTLILIIIIIIVIYFLLLLDRTGSTENLSSGSSTSGLQRAPSLPRSYRQRSGIPVLTRDSTC